MTKPSNQDNSKIEEILKKPETQTIIDTLKELKTNIINKESENTIKNRDIKIDLNSKKESSNNDIEENSDNKSSKAKDPRFLPKLEDNNKEKNSR